MENKLPKAWGSGTVQIMGIDLDCYILEDGTPVLSQRKVMKALGRTWKGTNVPGRPTFLKASNLQPFIKPDLEERLKGIEFTDHGKKINGYHAEILPLVCNVYLEARRAGNVLTTPQQVVARTAEALNMAFAIAGITALIYEQLGYEKLKNPNAIKN